MPLRVIYAVLTCESIGVSLRGRQKRIIAALGYRKLAIALIVRKDLEGWPGWPEGALACIDPAPRSTSSRCCWPGGDRRHLRRLGQLPLRRLPSALRPAA